MLIGDKDVYTGNIGRSQNKFHTQRSHLLVSSSFMTFLRRNASLNLESADLPERDGHLDLQTDGQTGQRMNGRTDKPAERDAQI